MSPLLLGAGWSIAAVLVGIFLGNEVCRRFSTHVRERYKAPKPQFRETGEIFPPWITGSVERVFFACLVAVDASGYAPAMVAWLALKLAASWTWPELEEKDASFEKQHAAQHSMRKSRIVSMLTGAAAVHTGDAVTMGFALAAGLMFKQAIGSLGC